MRLQTLIIYTAALLSSSITDGRRLGENEEEQQQGEETCPPARFKTKEDINLQDYASKKWYVHEQAETTYLPLSRNYCVTAEYKLLDKPTPFFGYTIEVTNQAQDSEEITYGGTIYAAETNESDPSKLEVAPGFLPRFLAGPYWIVDYNETEGYALVIGGPPQVKNEDTGKCRTNNRWITSSGGLWIFTRDSERDDALIDKVKGIASDLGLDTSVLNEVDHSNCQYDEA